MTPLDFCHWMKGYVELTAADDGVEVSFTGSQVTVMLKKLSEALGETQEVQRPPIMVGPIRPLGPHRPEVRPDMTFGSNGQVMTLDDRSSLEGPYQTFEGKTKENS